MSIESVCHREFEARLLLWLPLFARLSDLDQYTHPLASVSHAISLFLKMSGPLTAGEAASSSLSSCVPWDTAKKLDGLSKHALSLAVCSTEI